MRSRVAFALICAVHMRFLIDPVSALRALLCVLARLLLNSCDWKRIILYELVLHMAIGRADHAGLSGIMLMHSTTMLLFTSSRRVMKKYFHILRTSVAFLTIVFTSCVIYELTRAAFCLNLKFNSYMRSSLFYMIYIEHSFESFAIDLLSYRQHKNVE